MIQANENFVTQNTKFELVNIGNSDTVTYTTINPSLPQNNGIRTKIKHDLNYNLKEPRNQNVNIHPTTTSTFGNVVDHESIEEQQRDIERTKQILDVINPYNLLNRRDHKTQNIHIRVNSEGISDQYLKSLDKSNRILEFIGKHAYNRIETGKSSILQLNTSGIKSHKSINNTFFNAEKTKKNIYINNDSRIWEYRNTNLTLQNNSLIQDQHKNNSSGSNDNIKIKRSVLSYDKDPSTTQERKSILDILANIQNRNLENTPTTRLKKLKLVLDESNLSNTLFQNPQQFDFIKNIKDRKRFIRDVPNNDKRTSRDAQTSAQVNSNTNTDRGSPSSDQPSSARSAGNSGDSASSADNQRYTRVVRTKYGELRGKVKTLDSRHADAVEVYLGIPYASPPIGK